jgi:antitoxin VapB
MALSIKNKELEITVRELARVTGKPLTEALLVGAKRELERQKCIVNHKGKQSRVDAIMEIARRSAARPNISDMSEDEILGYDEFGAPTK